MKSNRNQYVALDGKLNVTGYNINQYRIKKGLSAQQLSDKLILLGLDIHRQSIFAIESGKRAITDYELCAIAEILEVSINDLLKNYIEIIRNELK